MQTLLCMACRGGGARCEDKRAAGHAHSHAEVAPKAARKQPTSKVVSLNSTELFAHLQQFQKVRVGGEGWKGEDPTAQASKCTRS